MICQGCNKSENMRVYWLLLERLNGSGAATDDLSADPSMTSKHCWWHSLLLVAADNFAPQNIVTVTRSTHRYQSSPLATVHTAAEAPVNPSPGLQLDTGVSGGHRTRRATTLLSSETIHNSRHQSYFSTQPKVDAAHHDNLLPDEPTSPSSTPPFYQSQPFAPQLEAQANNPIKIATQRAASGHESYGAQFPWDSSNTAGLFESAGPVIPEGSPSQGNAASLSVQPAYTMVTPRTLPATLARDVPTVLEAVVPPWTGPIPEQPATASGRQVRFTASGFSRDATQEGAYSQVRTVSTASSTSLRADDMEEILRRHFDELYTRLRTYEQSTTQSFAQHCGRLEGVVLGLQSMPRTAWDTGNASRVSEQRYADAQLSTSVQELKDQIGGLTNTIRRLESRVEALEQQLAANTATYQRPGSPHERTPSRQVPSCDSVEPDLQLLQEHTGIIPTRAGFSDGALLESVRELTVKSQRPSQSTADPSENPTDLAMQNSSLLERRTSRLWKRVIQRP